MPEAGSTSAADRRDARARAARWLMETSASSAADSPALAALGWDGLAMLPDWAHDDPSRLAELAWHVGAWSHAAALRRCIDGQLLTQLRMRLGIATFDALMQHDGPEVDPNREALAITTASIERRGAELLLGTIPNGALRELVRERLWPRADMLRVPPVAQAEALVSIARRHLPANDVAAEPQATTP